MVPDRSVEPSRLGAAWLDTVLNPDPHKLRSRFNSIINSPTGMIAMDKPQAEEVARVVMETGVQAQDDLQRKRAAEAASLARRHHVAWFALAGAALGSGGAYLSDKNLLLGFMLGGLAGAAIGWLFQRRSTT